MPMPEDLCPDTEEAYRRMEKPMLDDKQPFDRKHMTTVLDAILVAWNEQPFQRLGQLLANATQRSDLFNTEDTRLVKALNEYGKK